MFIDTHSHCFIPPIPDHIDEIIDHMRESHIAYAMQIGTDIESSKTCIALAKQYAGFHSVIGIHPTEAQNYRQKDIPLLLGEIEYLLHNNPVYGIGEIGMDYYHCSGDMTKRREQIENQKAWFQAQMNLAKKYSLPAVIHMRDCIEEGIQEIVNNGIQEFVIHCFSDNWDVAKKILAISSQSLISFTGLLTFPKNEAIREVARNIPLDRIMLETDAPYLIPHSLKGKVDFSEPAHTIEIFDTLCALRVEPRAHIEQQIWENSIQFFGLPP